VGGFERRARRFVDGWGRACGGLRSPLGHGRSMGRWGWRGGGGAVTLFKHLGAGLCGY